MVRPPFWPVETDAAERDRVAEVISKQLFISNWRGASPETVRSRQITHIAAIGEEFLEEDMEGVVYLKQDIADAEDQADAMSGLLTTAANFVHEAQKEGGRVLVHCAAGASRSATVVLAYLLRYQNMTLLAAFRLLRAKRKVVWPNEGFMRLLIALEKKTHGVATISDEQYHAWGEYDPEQDSDPEGLVEPASDMESLSLVARPPPVAVTGSSSPGGSVSRISSRASTSSPAEEAKPSRKSISKDARAKFASEASADAKAGVRRFSSNTTG